MSEFFLKSGLNRQDIGVTFPRRFADSSVPPATGLGIGNADGLRLALRTGRAIPVLAPARDPNLCMPFPIKMTTTITMKTGTPSIHKTPVPPKGAADGI